MDYLGVLLRSDPCNGEFIQWSGIHSAYGSVKPGDNQYKCDSLIFITVNNGMRELVFTQYYKL